MKILICEDERYWSEALKTAVAKWARTRNIEIHCNSFVLPQELIGYLTAHLDNDILFLDISLGEAVIDGMSLAKHVRKMGSSIPIIFVTVDSLRAADGYIVEATGFLSKPIDENRLALFLDRVVKRQNRSKPLRINLGNRMTTINQSDIVYIESADHIVTYHTVALEKIEARATLGEVLMELDKESFVQIHRSYIVALDKIDSIKTTHPYSLNLITTAKISDLPVSRKYIDNLLEVYSDNVWEKMI